MKTKKINSLVDFYKWVKSHYDQIKDFNQKMPYGNKFHLFFRGENNNYNDLIPSIYRNGRVINEHKIFNEALNQSPESFNDCNSTFDRLVRMQHYGIPTRLMDITEKPMVSLYFASDNISDKIPGKVYCFYISGKSIQYPNDFNTSLLATLSIMDSMLFHDGDVYSSFRKYIKAFNNFTNEKLPETRRKMLNNANIELMKNPIVKTLIDLAKRECGYIPKDFSVDNIAKIACVKPQKINSRVVNQGSAFLLFGFLCDKSLCLPLSSYKVFVSYFNALFSNDKNEKQKAEKELINSLPLNKEILNNIINQEKDFPLNHFASGRKSLLSREIYIEKGNLLSKILTNAYDLPLNTHLYEHTHKLNAEINSDLKHYFVLDNILNFIWDKYPIIFYDEVEIPSNKKEGLLEELSYLGINKTLLFPELESSSKEICKKYDHAQPLIIIKRGAKFIVYHIDNKIKTKLKEGDEIIEPKLKSVSDFWAQFVLSNVLKLKVKRKTSSGRSTNKYVEISCYEFSTKDNPLFSDFSD